MDDPDRVKVKEVREDDGSVVLELSVAQDDYGKRDRPGRPDGHRAAHRGQDRGGEAWPPRLHRHRRLTGGLGWRRTPIESWLHAGRVGKPHGLDGSFLVAEPNPSSCCGWLRASRSPAWRATIERRAGHDSARDPASRGLRRPRRGGGAARPGAVVGREHAPALEEDEWWAEDLEGCAVRDGERVVGTVARLLGASLL